MSQYSREVLRETQIWQLIKARAKLDGWSAVFGQGLIFIFLCLWALECLRDGGAF